MVFLNAGSVNALELPNGLPGEQEPLHHNLQAPVEICVESADQASFQKKVAIETVHFNPYKSNYILPATRILNEIDDRKESEIKFQISLQQQLINPFGFQVFVAYTQKSFWQAYDESKSRPFRETNYNPEIMLKSPKYRFDQGYWGTIIGYEHESNGENIPYSRSWNRIYARFLFDYEQVNFDYKIWYRLPEKKKTSVNDTEGDDNPDIHHYYGYSETKIGFALGQGQISLFGRMNAIKKKGALQIDLSYPFLEGRLNWYFQYWNGYGESLIDYNQSIIRVGIGIMLTRSNIY